MLASVMRTQIAVALLTVSPVLAMPDSIVKGSEEEATWLPRETGFSTVDDDGWSPRPTSSPGAGPNLAHFDLFRRYSGCTMGTDTCGFVATDWSNAITCIKIGAACTNDGAFMGCCTNTGRECYSTIKTACIDYSASLKGACDSLQSNTLCCSMTSSQFCHTFTFETTASPGLKLSLIGCSRSSGTHLLIDYSPTLTRTATSRPGGSSGGAVNPASLNSSSGPNPTAAADSTNSPAGNDEPDPPQGINAGVMAGAVVGGTAAISLIVLAILYLLRRRKSRTPTTMAFTGGSEKFHSPGAPGYQYSQDFPSRTGQFPYAPGGAYAAPGYSHAPNSGESPAYSQAQELPAQAEPVEMPSRPR